MSLEGRRRIFHSTSHILTGFNNTLIASSLPALYFSLKHVIHEFAIGTLGLISSMARKSSPHSSLMPNASDLVSSSKIASDPARNTDAIVCSWDGNVCSTSDSFICDWEKGNTQHWRHVSFICLYFHASTRPATRGGLIYLLWQHEKEQMTLTLFAFLRNEEYGLRDKTN